MGRLCMELKYVLEKRQNKGAVNDEGVVKELIENAKPILIYGCAYHAELVWEFLCNHGLKVEAFVVDSQYYRKHFFIKNTEVKDIAVYIKNIEEYNIVVGFCDIIKSLFLMDNKQLLKGYFYFLWEPLSMYEWDENYVKDHWKEFEEVYYNLADTHSKKILQELIKAKLNASGERILELADSRQYFNELTFCHNSQNEVFVDCGAFIGDTIKKYIMFTDGVYQKIYAFEPNPENVLKLKENVKNLKNIQVIERGTWKEKDTLEFKENGSASQVVENEGKIKIPVVTIDEVIGKEPVTFIKMDVEGSEIESLMGAFKTIKYNMPKLAICCYHKRDDIFNLYRYISGFNNKNVKYQFYLRHHSNSVYETVLYAIPVKVSKETENG